MRTEAQNKQIAWAAEWFIEVFQFFTYFCTREDVRTEQQFGSVLGSTILNKSISPRISNAREEVIVTLHEANKQLKQALEE
jgi:hypothetical protein